jgi:arsenite methyltransferase
VDCVISNCVINLAPDKPAAFREIARVLKPGGRLAVSDIALKRGLPPDLGDDLVAYVGCIAGAIPIEDHRRGLIEAGFSHVEVIDSGADLNAYARVENQAACCPPPASSSSPLAALDAGGDEKGTLCAVQRCRSSVGATPTRQLGRSSR